MKSEIPPSEGSPRYPGWRVVALCFCMAIFSWAFGFYGQSVFFAELQRAHRWPLSVISTAGTLYYLLSAVLVAFISDAIGRLGPRIFVAFGICVLAVGATALTFVTEIWQLYLVYLLMAFGWASTGVAAIATLVGLWFNEKRGMALSFALNGASIGGMAGVPALVFAVAALGFSGAVMSGAALMLVIVGAIALFLYPRASQASATPGAGSAGNGNEARGRALRSANFWTITVPFALVLLSQVGLIVHLIGILEPKMGRHLAGIAVGLLASAAVGGRIVLGFVSDRIDQRLTSALSFLSQAGALAVIAVADRADLLIAMCVLFGLSVGNVITLPALIIQREFPAQDFAAMVALSTAIGQFTYASGPGMIGVLRDLSGSYSAPLLACMAAETLAAAIVLIRKQKS